MSEKDKINEETAKTGDDEVTVLHVSNLSRNIKENHLQEIFGCYGEVKSVELAVDKRVGLSLGYAYIKYSKSVEAEEAASYLDGGQIDGLIVKISFVLVPKRRESPERATRREESHSGRQSDRDRKHDDRDTRNQSNDKYKNAPSRAQTNSRITRGRSRSIQRDRPLIRNSRDRHGSPPRRPFRDQPKRVGVITGRRSRSPPVRRDVDRRAPRDRRGRSPSPSPRRSRDRRSISRSRSGDRRRRYSRSSSRSYSSSSPSRSRSRSYSSRSYSTRSRSPSRSRSPDHRRRSRTRSPSPSSVKKD